MWKFIALLIGEIFKFLWENRHDTAEIAQVDEAMRERFVSRVNDADKRGLLPPSGFHKTRAPGNAGRGRKGKNLRSRRKR